MLADLDETIRQILIRDVPINPSEIDISFDAPDREWSGRLTRPAVNCFLYDLRENREIRVSEWEVRRGNGSATKQRGPLRIDTRYQVTAWARAPEDEHRLLWRVLAALMKHPTLPTDLAQGSLKDQPIAIPTWVAQPEYAPTNYADLWQALENRVRPTITYVVTLALDTEVSVTSPLVLGRQPRLDMDNLEPRDMADATRVRGRVRSREKPDEVIGGVLVLLRETGDQVMADELGQFGFARAPRGPITLIARSPGRPDIARRVTVPSDDYDLLI